MGAANRRRVPGDPVIPGERRPYYGRVMRAAYQGYHMFGTVRAQVWRFRAKHRRPRHFHREPELNLIASGSARFGVGDGVVEARAGDLLCFAPGQDHLLLAGSPDLDFFTVGVRPNLLREADLEADEGGLVLPVRAHLQPRDAEVVLGMAADLTDRPAPEQEVVALWSAARRAQRASDGASHVHVLTRRALRALAVHPELDRRGLAALGRTYPSEIGRHFRRDLGLTLVHYRTRMRLLRVIEQVDRCGCDFTVSALEAGFGSYSQLHRAFQAAFGVGPRLFFTAARREMEHAFEPAP